MPYAYSMGGLYNCMSHNTQINKFFTLKEFVAEEDLKSVLSNPLILSNIIELADILERLRKKIGRPILITSGYRNPEKNKKVGGADKFLAYL